MASDVKLTANNCGVSTMTEEEEKAAFAALLLYEPNEPFRAAIQMFPSNVSRAMFVAENWPHDLAVKQKMRELTRGENALDFLPQQYDAARLAWTIANDTREYTDDRLKALDLYCKVTGIIKTGNQTNTNVTVSQNRVMVIKDHGTDDEWEAKLQNQQSRLINGEFSVKH